MQHFSLRFFEIPVLLHFTGMSIISVPKLEDLRIKDCLPEMKQPTSVHRPNS